MSLKPHNQEKPAAGFTVALWVLTFLFCLRVLGQLIQQTVVISRLPGLEQWQGSALPYWLLLAFQLAILGIMTQSTRRYNSGRSVRSLAKGKWLLSVGAIYFVAMAGRLAIGLANAFVNPWFHKPIPAIFHLVLAFFVLLLGAYHMNWADRPALDIDLNRGEA